MKQTSVFPADPKWEGEGTSRIPFWAYTREDLYKKEKSTFDENLKVMGQRKEVLSKRLEQIAKLATMDKEAADQDLDALLAENRADFYKKYKDKFGLAKLIEFDKEVNKTHDKMYDFVVKEDERVRKEARRRKEKLEDEQRRKEDKIEAEKRALRDREEFAKYAAGLKGGGVGSDTASDVKNFTGVNFGTGKQADTKYDQVAAAANTIAEALALSNAVRKNPDVVGRMGQAKGFIDRYVKSLSSEGLETDKTPAATSKAEQDALLFSKRYAAYLIRYEQALAGSAKGFTVVRVRHYGSKALLQVSPREVSRLNEPSLRNDLVREIRQAGFAEVEFDPIGYQGAGLR
jgi:hypothetical protein